MTFSLTARCTETGQFGIAISSSSIAVGARCPWLQPGIGAVSSQNVTLPALGPRTLDGLTRGLTPEAALAQSLASDGYAAYRQVTVIDAQGRSAHHSGAHTLGVHQARSGRDCVGAGNMLASPAVVDALVENFESTQGALAERLVKAMQAAMAAGGEAGPVHSAALLVVGEPSWPIVNLRVDWAETDPIGQLTALWRAYEPQLQDYLDRAVRPDLAPGYGVPGDDR